jgi:hypothetical protein
MNAINATVNTAVPLFMFGFLLICFTLTSQVFRDPELLFQLANRARRVPISHFLSERCGVFTLRLEKQEVI